MRANFATWSLDFLLIVSRSSFPVVGGVLVGGGGGLEDGVLSLQRGDKEKNSYSRNR